MIDEKYLVSLLLSAKNQACSLDIWIGADPNTPWRLREGKRRETFSLYLHLGWPSYLSEAENTLLVTSTAISIMKSDEWGIFTSFSLSLT
jgi:hypothetical protein